MSVFYLNPSVGLLAFLTTCTIGYYFRNSDAISLGTESGGCPVGSELLTEESACWAGGYTPGRSEKLGRVSRNSPRGSREKSGKAELSVKPKKTAS